MKKLILISLFPALMASAGCSGQFWGGTGAGVAGTGAGYEYNAKRELDRIKKDREAGTMTEEEYNIRKDQIKRMSIIQ
jgi:hypothetical protein